MNRRTVFTFPRHSTLLLLVLVVIAFLPRLYFNATTDSVTYGTDSAARFIQAKEWYITGEGIPGGLIWLPFFHVLILALVPLGASFELSGRVVLLTLSVLSIPLFYTLIRKLFRTEIAFWSALLLAINPFHVLYSSFYMSENLFLFFVIASFYFLLLFLDSGKTIHLVISSVLVNGAAMLRYEGWLIAGLLPWFLFFKRKDLLLSSKYFLSNCVFILIYCERSLSSYHHLVWGVYTATTDVQANLATLPDKLAHAINMLSSELIFPVWFYLMLFTGIAYALVMKIKPAYLFVWSALFAFSAYKVLTLTSQPFWRYFSCPLLMLIPYGAYWFAEISKRDKNLFAMTFLVVITLSIPSLADSYKHRQLMSKAPVNYKKACRLLKTERRANEKVIFDIRISGYDHASFQEDVDISSSQIFYPMSPWLKMFSNYEEFSGEKLPQLLLDTSYYYLFLQKGLLLDSVLYSSPVQQEIASSQIKLDTIFNSNDYQLFQIRR